MVVVSQFNGTSTPKGSYSAKTGENDCNVNSSRYGLSTALWEQFAIRPSLNKMSDKTRYPGAPRGGCSHAPLEALRTTNCICRVFFMSNSLTSIWCLSVHYEKFPMFRFPKGYCSPSFHPIWVKCYIKHGNRRWSAKIKQNRHFEFFVNIWQYRANINFKTLNSFHPISAKLYWVHRLFGHLKEL